MNKRQRKKMLRKYQPLSIESGLRAFISQDGNDNNDCSLQHPCKTLSRALKVAHKGYVFILSPKPLLTDTEILSKFPPLKTNKTLA